MNKTILIYSDSQATLKALSSYKYISKVAWDCLQKVLKWSGGIGLSSFGFPATKDLNEMNMRIGLHGLVQASKYLGQSLDVTILWEWPGEKLIGGYKDNT